MTLTTHREWTVSDLQGNPAPLPAGVHPVTRIPHPLGLDGCWLVTEQGIGAGEKFWRQWVGAAAPFGVEITE